MYVNIAHRYDGVGQRNQIDLKKKKKTSWPQLVVEPR